MIGLYNSYVDPVQSIIQMNLGNSFLDFFEGGCPRTPPYIPTPAPASCIPSEVSGTLLYYTVQATAKSQG